jgi:hypothetical protein
MLHGIPVSHSVIHEVVVIRLLGAGLVGQTHNLSPYGLPSPIGNGV